MTLDKDYQPLVHMSHIHKVFNRGSVNETVVFNDFNLTIGKGEFVSIVGSNGSGKTTLLNLLCGSLFPDSGSIVLRDKTITNLAEYRRAAFIGRVMQNPAMGTCPSLSILENMSLARNKGHAFNLSPGVNKKDLAFYKEQLQLLHLGLEDKLDVAVGSLSGGQRQALALLISTMTPVDILVLDEHTAALDPKSSENVMELTEKIVREKKLTTIMVTHNLKYAVRYGNRLIMLHQGNCLLDIYEEEKSRCEINDLLKIFNEISIECGN